MIKVLVIITLIAIVISMLSSGKNKTKVNGYTESGEIRGHSFVDMGLPSGRLWATCNVGATKPAEYGDYFAWGETKPKEDYSWDTYKHMSNSYHSLPDSEKYGQCINKYTVQESHKAYYKYEFVGDDKRELEVIDDAATANWGIEWRMPTKVEQEELLDGCNWEWTESFNGSGIAGRIGTSKTNGNTIFLPAAGYRDGTGLDDAGYNGDYWSSSLYENDSHGAYDLYFGSDSIDWGNYGRYDGLSVRAVVR